MSFAMYEEQKRKVDRLFQAHAIRQAEEKERDRLLAIDACRGFFAPPRNPVAISYSGMGLGPKISTRPFSMIPTPETEALRLHYAIRAQHEAAVGHAQHAAAVTHAQHEAAVTHAQHEAAVSHAQHEAARNAEAAASAYAATPHHYHHTHHYGMR